MLFEIMAFRRKFKAVVRDEGRISWTSREYESEVEVRAAIEALKETDWSAIEVVISKY
jgi:hypothetical protein